MEVRIEGSYVQLPKLTMSLAERMEVQGDFSERIKGEYQFLRDVLPKDVLDSAVDGTTLKDADVTEIQSLYSKVRAAYSGRTLESVMETVESLDLSKLQSLIDTVSKAQDLTRQGFSNVR